MHLLNGELTQLLTPYVALSKSDKIGHRLKVRKNSQKSSNVINERGNRIENMINQISAIINWDPAPTYFIDGPQP